MGHLSGAQVCHLASPQALKGWGLYFYIIIIIIIIIIIDKLEQVILSSNSVSNLPPT